MDASPVFGPNTELISRYVDILAGRGIEWGLVGPREGPRLWDRHVLNSIAIADLLPADSDLVDVGSGAGLPGTPLAIYRPDLKVTLLESLLRRANFLEAAVAELGLADRVRVVRARAEEHRTQYDVVTARAVAPLGRLISWCAPLLRSPGRLVALKGESAAKELGGTDPKLLRGLQAAVQQLAVPGTDEQTWAVVLDRD